MLLLLISIVWSPFSGAALRFSSRITALRCPNAGIEKTFHYGGERPAHRWLGRWHLRASPSPPLSARSRKWSPSRRSCRSRSGHEKKARGRNKARQKRIRTPDRFQPRDWRSRPLAPQASHYGPSGHQRHEKHARANFDESQANRRRVFRRRGLKAKTRRSMRPLRALRDDRNAIG